MIMGMPGKHAPAEERFWRHVRKSDGCWEWTGSTNDSGYGQFKVDKWPVKAHRFSWLLHFGSIPGDLLVCHHCDNPPCVRPDHLFLGSVDNNNHDKMRKGRQLHGAHGVVDPARLKGRRKLSDEQVREIRRRYAAGQGSTRLLAVEYAVAHTTIVRVVARKHFADVG